MLFALLASEEARSMIPPDVNSVVNMTALAILGYHLLVGLPRLLDRILDSQERSNKVNTENMNALQAQFMVRNDRVVEAINRQTEAIGDKLAAFATTHNRRERP